MTDFVLMQNENLKTAPEAYDQYLQFVNYANFLKQPLTLGMFVPCDENGNVLGEPTFDNYMQPKEMLKQDEVYQKAKEKVLFKEFDTKGGLAVSKAICTTYKTIEELTHKKVPLVDLKLTESAIKQIEL